MQHLIFQHNNKTCVIIRQHLRIINQYRQNFSDRDITMVAGISGNGGIVGLSYVLSKSACPKSACF